MTTRTAVRATRPSAPRSLKDDTRFDVANRVFFRLYQASNLMHRTGTRAVAAHGATTQQWAVMGALSRPGVAEGGMSVKELMAFLCVSRQSLTLVLARLEGLGLVERARIEGDGRVRRICLTAGGQRMWRAMQGDIRAFYATAMGGFTGAEAEALFGLLDRLAAGMRG